MRWKKYARSILTLLSAVLFLSMAFPTCTYADSRHVYDELGLLSMAETTMLEEKCEEFEAATKMHALIYTTSTTRNPQSVADDFYDEKYPDKSDIHGFCIVIDMGSREIALSTSGNMQYYLSDSEVDWILDNAYGYAGSGEYSICFESVINDVKYCVDQGISEADYFIDENGNVTRYRSITAGEAILAAVIGLFSGSGTFFGIKKSYQKKKAKDQVQYSALRKFTLLKKQDILINRFVQTRRIERNTGGGSAGGGNHGSTVHHSSSGRTHGGGSRKF